MSDVASGIGIARLLDGSFEALPVQTARSFVLLAEMIAVAVGLIAGVLPASRTAGLDPVDALRAE